MATPSFFIVHISASHFGDVNLIRGWHKAPPLSASDIGYHGVILNGFTTGEDWKAGRRVPWLNGEYSIGRLWNGDGNLDGTEVGAHARGFNADSFSVCLVADIEKESGLALVTPEQLEKLYTVASWFQVHFGIPVDHVIGHREIGRFKPEFATDKACPGFEVEWLREAMRSPMAVTHADRFVNRFSVERQARLART